MSRWFRMYDEVLDDPKVQRLSADDFKAWINILCVASRNDGKIPPIADLSFALRLSANDARTLVERFLNGGLIDRRTGGADGWHYAPHGWDKRQYKSDTSTARVKRFRKRNETVSETPPETEAETDTEKKEEVNREKVAAPLAFEGRVIHLNHADLARWEKNYPSIDVRALLQSRDDWMWSSADEKLRKNWFIPTSNYLSRMQAKASGAQKMDDDDHYRFDSPC